MYSSPLVDMIPSPWSSSSSASVVSFSCSASESTAVMDGVPAEAPAPHDMPGRKHVMGVK